MRKLTFILGGARSGKSDYAQRLAEAAAGDVLFVATAQAFDADMEARIAKHRLDRPAEWETLEAPVRVGEGLSGQPAFDTIVIDCMTLLTSNIVLKHLGPEEGELDADAAEAEMNEELDMLLDALHRTNSHAIVISNEVGLGIVPGNRLSRVYRDILGRVNQRLAREADEAILLVAGLPMTLKG